MAGSIISKNMRIFGLPYQFTDKVDPRFDDISSTVGRKYLRNILFAAPVVTIIPGLPSYLPSAKDKQSTSNFLLSMGSDNFSPILNAGVNEALGLEDGETFRYYDFKPAYTEYMTYVNILCRTLATFLDIRQTIDGVAFQEYDWRAYNRSGVYSSVLYNAAGQASSVASQVGDMVSNVVGSVKNNLYTWAVSTVEAPTLTSSNSVKTDDSGNIKKDSNGNPIMVGDVETIGVESKTDENGNRVVSTKVKQNFGKYDMVYQTTTEDPEEETLNDIFQTRNYVQFYIDPEGSGSSDNFSNETSPSQLKSAFEKGQSTFKEIAFLTNSGGLSSGSVAQSVSSFTDDMTNQLANAFSGNSLTDFISRFITVGKSIVKGANVIMPDIYQSSSHPTQYTLTVRLKNIYGTKFGFFMNIGVPLMHLLALAIPKQATANTYGSPFLIKASIEGMWATNLAIVNDLSFNKTVNAEGWTADGLPNEVDVTMTVTDLYSDLSMSSQTNPSLFVNNTSLLEFLANTCGLSLVNPSLQKKYEMATNTFKNAFKDIPKNVFASTAEDIDSWIFKRFSM